ncbi:hypothetical protein UFOVP1446_1, partial [uncultured Caudovirales phage]
MTGPFRFSPEQSSTGFDFSLGSDANPMLETARGRAQEQSQNSADNLDKLITLRERTKDPLQADRLDRLIKQYTSLKTGSIGDFAAGAAGGVADAPLSVVSTLLGLGPSSISNVAARGRRGVQEAQAGLRELTGNTDPTNIAGTVGEMAGGMIGGAPVFGKAAQAVGAGVSKVIPALEPLMTGATDLSKISNPAVRAIVQRMTSGTANVIAGAPINAAQTLSSEAPWDEKVKSAAIQSGADFLFGLGHTPSAKPKVTNTVDPNTPAATPESGALADELSAKFKEAEANRAAAKQLREEAKAQWIVDNMAGGKKWGDLSKNDKAQVYVDYSEKRKAPEVAPTELPADTQPSPIKPTDILDPTAADIPALRDRAAVAIDDATAAAKTPRTEDPNGPPQASTPVEQEIASAEYHINRLKQVGDLAGANDLIPHLNKVKKLVGMEPMALEVLPVLDKLGKMNSDQLDNHLDEIYKVLDSAHEKSPEYVQASNDLNDVINEKLRRQQMGKDPLLDEVKGLPAEPATIAPPVDPIQDKLEALKRGETITPKMPEELNSNLEKEFLRINVRDLTPRELLDTYNKWQSWIGGQKELWDMTDHNLDAETQSLQKIKNLPGGYLEDPYAVHRMIAEDLKSAVRQSRVINAAARLEKTGQLDQILSLRHDDRMSMQGIAEKLSINPDTVMDVLEFLGKTEIQYGQPRPKDVAAMNAATKVELDKLNAIKETADRTLKMLHQMSVPQMEQGKIPTPDTTVPTPGEALADGLRKGPKAVRAKDFAETGNYDVEINGKVYQIFRDADAKAWYQDPSNTGEHFSKNWLGTTKTEALAALHERVTGEKKSAMLENIGRTVESRKAAKEVSLTGETPKGEQLDVKRLAQPVSKLPDGQIQLQIDHVHEKLAEAKTLNDSDMIGDYERRLSKLMDEQAKRKGPPDAPSSGKGLTANIPPGIGGALLGATYGLRTAKDDEDAAKRAFLYAMIGGFGSSAVFRGGNYIARMRELRKESGELFAGELALRKNSKLAIETSKTLSELIDDAKSRPRQAYEQVANRSIGAQRVAAAFPQLHNAPMESNFAKQIFTAGRWVSKTENALGGDGITITGKNGNPIHVTGPYNKILAMVNGDVDGLDRVRIALASAEGAIAGRQVPMDLQTREAYIRNAPKEYIEASKAARDYNLGLMKVMLEAGRISTEGYAAMANEQWYAPLLQAAKDVSSAKYAKLRFVGQEKVVFGRKQGGSTE